MEKKKHNKRLAIILIIAVILIALVPLFAMPGADFGGSDDAGSQMVNEITGTDYQPWATPILEKILGGELPGEIESLFFCIQTGIGVGIVAFILGRLVERRKWMNKNEQMDTLDSDAGDSNKTDKN